MYIEFLNLKRATLSSSLRNLQFSFSLKCLETEIVLFSFILDALNTIKVKENEELSVYNLRACDAVYFRT